MSEKTISFDLPSQIEIAEALHSMPPGPNRETVRRMATALDLVRSGGWELVRRPADPEPRLEENDGPRALCD